MLEFDHAVLNVMGEMDQMADLYRRFGFALTPRGYHTLGSINHLAVFDSCYLELLGYAEGEREKRAEQWAYPAGLTGLAMRCADAPALHQGAQQAGVPLEPWRAFSRPVEVGGQHRDAKFRTFQIDRAALANGRIFFCEHQTPELIWRPEDQRHPNGVTGIAAAYVACDAPEALAGLVAQVPGVARAAACSLRAGKTRLEFARPEALALQFGGDPLPGMLGAPMRIVALELACRSLPNVGDLLSTAGVDFSRHDGAVQIPAAVAGGMILRFVAAR